MKIRTLGQQWTGAPRDLRPPRAEFATRARVWRAPAALAVFCAALLGAGCATAPPEEEVPSAQGYYERAEAMLEGERAFLFFTDVDYPRAIQYFQEVIDNYPYSEYAVLAELQIADIHFDRERYEEAASYYQDFVDLHPNHKRVPYALYRGALCSFEQMAAPDRDQRAAREAVAQLEALIDNYPNSDAIPEAEARLAEASGRLAQQDILVADFYYEQGIYHAALNRYRAAMERHPQHRERLETMARVGFSLARVGRPFEAETLLRRILADVPESDEELRDRIAWELERIASHQRFGPRPMPDSCATDPNPSCPTER